jgi:hypothetical protein
MNRRCLAALLATALLPLFAASARAQVLFRMDYSSAAYPNAGWSDGATAVSSHFTRQLLAGAAPDGSNAILMHHIPGDPVSQFYWGWAGYAEQSGSLPGGTVRYYRWRMFFPTNTNLSGNGLGSVVNKLLIVGDGCGERCRIIVTYGPRTGVTDINFRVQIDGGIDPINVDNLPKGQWLNIQIEARSSSGSNNGGYKIWINNNNYSSPSAQIGNVQLAAREWGLVKFGAYCNANLASNGVHDWRHANFEVATTFDATWNSSGGGGGGGPTPPTGVRIVSE